MLKFFIPFIAALPIFSQDPWGYHLSLDCKSCEQSSITDKTNIEAFVIDLVEEIHMQRYGEAGIIHFGTGDKAGFTLIQLIETSCITAHFCDESGDAYIDIFSCLYFDMNTVENAVKYWFHPKEIHYRFFKRQA